MILMNQCVDKHAKLPNQVTQVCNLDLVTPGQFGILEPIWVWVRFGSDLAGSLGV